MVKTTKILLFCILTFSLILFVNAQGCESPQQSANSNIGKIQYVLCKDTEYLSDGSSWLPCSDFNRINVQGHDYLCRGGIAPPETSDISIQEISLQISSSTLNYNIYDAANKPTLPSQITLTINQDVTVGSTSTSKPSLTTGYLPKKIIVAPNSVNSFTKLMLHLDQDIIDSSTSSHTVTAKGHAKISSSQNKFGSSSATFDGNKDYIAISNSNDFNFGANDFTIDLWFKLTEDGTYFLDRYLYDITGGPTISLIDQQGSTPIIRINMDTNHDYSWTEVDADWHHIALVRANDQVKTYLDGNEILSWLDSGTYGSSSNILHIGSRNDGKRSMYGFIDEVRVSKGLARWISNFNLPINPHENEVVDSAKIPQNDGTLIGDYTQGNGLTAAFDNINKQDSDQSAKKTITSTGFNNYIGKDWGENNKKIIMGFKAWSSINDGFLSISKAPNYRLEGSSTGEWNGEQVTLKSGTLPLGIKQFVAIFSGIEISTPYRFHRVVLQGDGQSSSTFSELEFWGLTVLESTVTIINNGKVIGAGGNGGNGNNGGPGEKGGTAIHSTSHISIDNNGIISGGGGGGGGGTRCGSSECYDDPGGAGGGGAGYQPGQKGASCGGSSGGDASQGNYVGGSGGPICNPGGESGESPGAKGGDIGLAGSSSSGHGGSAGVSIKTSGKTLTWINNNEGDLRGPIDNTKEDISLGTGRESWMECCGDDSCTSTQSEGGKTLSTGQPAITSQETYYCTPEKLFITNSDLEEEEATCTAADFKWTGSRCCGNNIEEYYNDDSSSATGGCWNNKFISSENFIDDPQREDIINLNGIFSGCNIQGDNILDRLDSYSNQPLIQNKDFCFQDTQTKVFCSSENKWQFSEQNVHLSEAPFDVQQKQGCCAQDQCWDGNTCRENMKNDFSSAANEQDYRCIDGDWQKINRKYTPSGELSGFCPEKSQCLLDPRSNAPINCIENNEFNDDNYCENGNWTSRTKFITLQLIAIAGNKDYTLFCDTPQNTLNYLDQKTQTLITEGKINNFCILELDPKNNKQTIIGASLNKGTANNVLSALDKTLEILDVDNCNSALDAEDGKYHQCKNKEAWYNNKLQSILYSKQEIFISDNNIFQTIISLLKSLIKDMINFIQGNIEAPYDESYIEGINRFDKIYMTKKTVDNKDKIIRGSIQKTSQLKNLVIEYRNLETDICGFIDEYNQKNDDAVSGIECTHNEQEDTYYVLAQGFDFRKIDPEAIWNDLTSNLRLT